MCVCTFVCVCRCFFVGVLCICVCIHAGMCEFLCVSVSVCVLV